METSLYNEMREKIEVEINGVTRCVWASYVFEGDSHISERERSGTVQSTIAMDLMKTKRM